MHGPLRKPADRRQRRNQPAATLVAVARVARPTPEPPTGLLAASVTAWARLWHSELAAHYLDTDMPAIERLWGLYDERARAIKVATKGRIVEGSKAQPVLNPLLPYVASLDSEIRALEDRFGLTPKARLALGIQLGEAHRSLADLNRAFMEEVS
jgi:P27 family predicted phage terminase small subunit